MKNKQEQLSEILNQMDIPPFRFNDLSWLSRNITIRNVGHEKINEARQLIKELINEKRQTNGS